MAPGNAVRRLALLAVISFSAALPPLAWAAPDAPQPQPVAAHAVDATSFVGQTRSLEASPRQPGAVDLRKAMLRWLVETPDYQVTICDVMGLPDLPDEPKEPVVLGLDLLMQQSFGNLAYQIDHGSEGDELSRQVAGVESAIMAYQAFVAADSTWQFPAMDVLAAQQKAGTLRTHLAPVVKAECGDGAASSPPPFLGGVLRATSVVYPVQVADWKAVGERRYDSVGAGASVRYQRDGREHGWIDVYFYPVGRLEPHERARLVESERSGLLEARKGAMARKDDMSRIDSLRFTVPALGEGGSDHLEASAMDFGFHRDGKQYSSVMILALDRLYAIKLRYSVETSTASRKKARRELEEFAGVLLPQLDIVSSGTCGDVPADARVSQRLGCVETDSALPVVGEGRREMRFEYAPPRISKDR